LFLFSDIVSVREFDVEGLEFGDRFSRLNALEVAMAAKQVEFDLQLCDLNAERVVHVLAFASASSQLLALEAQAAPIAL